MKRVLLSVCFVSLMMGMYATAAIAEDIEALDWNEPETTVNMDEAVDVGDEGNATGGAEITDQEERRGGFKVYFKRIHPYKREKGKSEMYGTYM